MNTHHNPICVGTGLVALDVVVTGTTVKDAQFLAGGTCGNVLTILSYLGWVTYPISRLSNNVATGLLLEDLTHWGVKDDLLTVDETGSTPVIIHRILKDKEGSAKHRFEFRNPEDGTHLPAYKPARAKDVGEIFAKRSQTNVFFFDRINRGAINLAKLYKESGSVVFFEPSSAKDAKGFHECISIADVVKFSDDRIPGYDTMYPVGLAALEIQTMGKFGLKYRLKGESDWKHISGYQIDSVIDTAGAGDWCSASIIYHLFKDATNLVKDCEQIEYALRFGQVLSALNCTFESARGLMYHVKRSELFLYVDHFLNSSTISISQRKIAENVKEQAQQTTISSLFNKL